MLPHMWELKQNFSISTQNVDYWRLGGVRKRELGEDTTGEAGWWLTKVTTTIL